MSSIKLMQEMDISVQMYRFLKVSKAMMESEEKPDNKQPTDLLYLNGLQNQPVGQIIDV